MHNPVPMDKRRERNEMLRILSEKKRRFFYEQHLGHERTVLLEASEHDGVMSGFTDNYIKVTLPYQAELVNSLAQVRLVSVTPDGDSVHATLLS
jgi:threonylcarbamoyladenosine tRNA methylthiotransferase MtaB